VSARRLRVRVVLTVERELSPAEQATIWPFLSGQLAAGCLAISNEEATAGRFSEVSMPGVVARAELVDEGGGKP
jgi:hypothetical protein